MKIPRCRMSPRLRKRVLYAERDASSALTDSPERKDDGIFGSGASAPKDEKDNASGAPEATKASTTQPTAVVIAINQ